MSVHDDLVRAAEQVLAPLEAGVRVGDLLIQDLRDKVDSHHAAKAAVVEEPANESWGAEPAFEPAVEEDPAEEPTEAAEGTEEVEPTGTAPTI